MKSSEGKATNNIQEKAICLTADLSAETLQARRDIFKVLKGKNLQDYCTQPGSHSKSMEK